jgi:hypothetical protein
MRLDPFFDRYHSVMGGFGLTTNICVKPVVFMGLLTMVNEL